MHHPYHDSEKGLNAEDLSVPGQALALVLPAPAVSQRLCRDAPDDQPLPVPHQPPLSLNPASCGGASPQPLSVS